MSDILPSRPRTTRNYAAIALFLAVYAGVLLIILAPRDMIGAQSGSVIQETE